MQALNDPARDAPAAHLMANCMVTALPCACGLFISQCNSHWIGAAYLIVNYVLYLQRFMLTIHMSEHRKLFKPGDSCTLSLPSRLSDRQTPLHRVCLNPSKRGSPFSQSTVP